MPSLITLGSYRGRRLFQAVDARSRPVGPITVEDIDGTFPSVAIARLAIDALLELAPDAPSASLTDDGPGF